MLYTESSSLKTARRERRKRREDGMQPATAPFAPLACVQLARRLSIERVQGIWNLRKRVSDPIVGATEGVCIHPALRKITMVFTSAVTYEASNQLDKEGKVLRNVSNLRVIESFDKPPLP